ISWEASRRHVDWPRQALLAAVDRAIASQKKAAQERARAEQEAKRRPPEEVAKQACRERASRRGIVMLRHLEMQGKELESLVEVVFVVGQPIVIGGPYKSLKTSLAADLAISLAAGTPFLGTFPVPRARCTAFLSGESGEVTLRQLATRIAMARGLQAVPDGVS